MACVFSSAETQRRRDAETQKRRRRDAEETQERRGHADMQTRGHADKQTNAAIFKILTTQTDTLIVKFVPSRNGSGDVVTILEAYDVSIPPARVN